MMLLLRLAGALQRDQRHALLQRVAQELQGHELGDGVVHRIVSAVPREFYRPPDLGHRHASRWSSRRANGVRASAEG